eukprot:jgi/Botrbrau1/1924/Bobra.0005s0029.2
MAAVPFSTSSKNLDPIPVGKDSSGSSKVTKDSIVPGDTPQTYAQWKQWLSGEAGTPLDGWLLTVSSQIGQIMLTLPNAMAKVGVAAAIPIALGTATMSLWTMYLLITLYVERKAILVAKGLWFDEAGERKVITQYHEVIGDLLGKWARYIVIAVISIALFGTCVAQIVASSADAYYFSESIDKRTWSLIWGGIMMVTPLLPSFRHFRIINIIGIIGTTFTAWYIVGVSAAHGEEKGHVHWTSGQLVEFLRRHICVLFSFWRALHGSGNHGFHVPTRAVRSRVLRGFSVHLYPDPSALNQRQHCFPRPSLCARKCVWISFHRAGGRRASIILMLIHQVCAFAYYSAPLYYMWEKFLHVHESPYWDPNSFAISYRSRRIFLCCGLPFLRNDQLCDWSHHFSVHCFHFPRSGIFLVVPHEGKKG